VTGTTVQYYAAMLLTFPVASIRTMFAWQCVTITDCASMSAETNGPKKLDPSEYWVYIIRHSPSSKTSTRNHLLQ
jgi:hypothetical protein